MKRKKAEGMPINVIVFALVALIVLIVVVAIFTGKIKGVSTGLSDCVSKGGNCGTPQSQDCPSGSTEVGGISRCSNGNKCCMSVFEQEKKAAAK